MRLRVHGAEARRKMLRVEHRTFQTGLERNWHAKQDGAVAAQSLMWLYCWAKTGLNSETAMHDTRRLWDEITGVPFSHLDTADFHSFALRHRYDAALSDEGLLGMMESTARRDVSFLRETNQAGFPNVNVPEPPSLPAKEVAATYPPVTRGPGRLSAQDQAALQAVCRATDDRLWQAHRASANPSTAYAAGLIFPEYTSRPGLRISEQEARQFLCRELDAGGQFAYSVETPTVGRYAWSSISSGPQGSSGMSARLDATLYRTDGSRVVNVEFKAGGAGVSIGQSASQDMVKLLIEPCDGLWFGLLESTDERFLRTILESLWTTVIKVTGEGVPVGNLPMILVFHICELAHGLSVHRSVRVPDPKAEKLMSAQEFASLRYRASPPPGGAREVSEQGGWTTRYAPVV